MVAGRVFYVGISVINLFLISVFWSFLLEFFQSEQTKRLFGFIAAGGTTGALVGPFITERIVNHVGISGILYFGAAMFFVAIFCQRALLAEMRDHATCAPLRAPRPRRPRHRGVGGNPFAGVAIVLKSPYLLGIALFVIMISTANTILYFEQLRLVKDMFENPEQRTQMFARIDFIVQTLTVVSQLLITGTSGAQARRDGTAGDTAAAHHGRLPAAGEHGHLPDPGRRHDPAPLGRIRLHPSGSRDVVEPARHGNQVQGEELHRRHGVPLLRCRRGPGAGCAQGGWHESGAGRLVRRRRMCRVGGQRLVAGAQVRQGKSSSRRNRPAAGNFMAADFRLRLMPSSVIRSYRYDPLQRRLELQFVSGRRYRYHDVPEETWRGMRQAFSKGEFFNAHIRDHYRFTRES